MQIRDSVFSPDVTYTLSYGVTVSSPVKPVSIVSPSHNGALVSATDENNNTRITSERNGVVLPELTHGYSVFTTCMSAFDLNVR